MEEIIDTQAPVPWVGEKDIEAAMQRILASKSGKRWRTGTTLDLGLKRWKPTAVSADRKRLLYIFLQEELPRHVQERLKLATELGIEVTVALHLAALFQHALVELLVEVDATVVVLDDYFPSRQLEPRAVLAAIADIDVPVSPDLRVAIASAVWQRIEEGTSQQKGRRLEALLAFLLAQIRDLKVVERNYRTETEEIDIVLQVDSFSPRVWQKPGVPFILVEAKNRVDKATQQVVSTLITKLQTNRGTSRIAFLVSLAGFTEDAKMQELRFSTQDICIAMIDRAQLATLISAKDIDTELESLVRRALLR